MDINGIIRKIYYRFRLWCVKARRCELDMDMRYTTMTFKQYKEECEYLDIVQEQLESTLNLNMFSPKTCKYKIETLDDVFKALDDVCDRSNKLTDEELNNELKHIYNFCAGGSTGKDFYFVSHLRSDELVRKRVEKYCRKNKMKLEEYDGCLPFMLSKIKM